MSEFSGAKCIGLWWVFDSTGRPEHRWARRVCEGCPALEACRKLAEQEVEIGSLTKGGAIPNGTYAGELWVEGRRTHVPEKDYNDPIGWDPASDRADRLPEGG